MPVPVNVSTEPALAVTVYGFVAVGVKLILLTSVFAEIETAGVLERANVAVSAEPFGTVAGVQFVAVFQSPDPGLRSHVALPAKVLPAAESSKNMAVARKVEYVRRQWRKISAALKNGLRSVVFMGFPSVVPSSCRARFTVCASCVADREHKRLKRRAY